MAQVTSKTQDSAVADSSAAVAYAGSQIVAQEHVIMYDVFEGSTIDTDKWTASTASGGTNTQSAGITLATSTNTAGNANILSVPVAIFLPYAELSFKAHLRMGTVPVASNTREMTLKVDSNNYAQFLLNGTEFVCRVYAAGAGVAADVPVSMVNPGGLGYMDLEIRVLPEAVYFIGDGVQLASFGSRGSTTRLWQTGVLAQAYFRTLNAGAATDNTMLIRSVMMTRRFAALPGIVRAKKMTADGIVARGPCWYLGCKRITDGDGTAVIYDNTAASGKIIDEYGSAGIAASVAITPGAIECINGIYVDLTTDSLMIYYIS